MTARVALAGLLATLTLVACGRSDFGTDADPADVEAALSAQGVEICESLRTEADLPGAVSERRYDVAIDCEDRDGSEAAVVVTTFEDAADRDGAARRFEVTGRPTGSGAVWTLGPLLVRVGGDRDPEVVDRIADALDGLEAR